MALERKAATHVGADVRVDMHHRNSEVATKVRQHSSPRVDGETVAVGVATIGMSAALRGCDDVTAAVERACADEDVPVILSGRHRERGGEGDHVRPARTQSQEQFRKPDIVSGRKAERTDWCIFNHNDIVARRVRR